METFEYKDHADDALSVAALDGDCDGCPTGAGGRHRMGRLIMNEQQFRAAVEAAVRRLVEGDGEGITSPRFVVDEIMGVVEDYASERWSEGHTQGMCDEREVHFG